MNHILITMVNRLGIFMISAQMVIHFCAKKEYEKHISLLAGLMIIVICALPVAGAFKNDVNADFHESINTFEKSLTIALDSFEHSRLEAAEDFYTAPKKEVSTDESKKENANISITDMEEIQEIEPIRIGEK